MVCRAYSWLCSGFTPGNAWGPFRCWEVELGSATCKASGLPTVLSLRPTGDLKGGGVSNNTPRSQVSGCSKSSKTRSREQGSPHSLALKHGHCLNWGQQGVGRLLTASIKQGAVCGLHRTGAPRGVSAVGGSVGSSPGRSGMGKAEAGLELSWQTKPPSAGHLGHSRSRGTASLRSAGRLPAAEATNWSA